MCQDVVPDRTSVDMACSRKSKQRIVAEEAMERVDGIMTSLESPITNTWESVLLLAPPISTNIKRSSIHQPQNPFPYPSCINTSSSAYELTPAFLNANPSSKISFSTIFSARSISPTRSALTCSSVAQVHRLCSLLRRKALLGTR